MNVLLILFNEPSEWLNSAAQFRLAFCFGQGRAFFWASVWCTPIRDVFCAFCVCNMYFLSVCVCVCVRLAVVFYCVCPRRRNVLICFPIRFARIFLLLCHRLRFDCLLPVTCIIFLYLYIFLFFVFAFMARHTPSSMLRFPLAIWYLSLGWHKIWAHICIIVCHDD